MSNVQKILLATVWVLLAAGLVVVLTGDATPRPVPISFVSLGETWDPNQIGVHYGCFEGGPEELTLVSEQPEAVTLSLVVYGDSCVHDGGVIGFVRLREPLGDRQVINQFDGSQIEVRGR